jgi:hypothetical protein
MLEHFPCCCALSEGIYVQLFLMEKLRRELWLWDMSTGEMLEHFRPSCTTAQIRQPPRAATGTAQCVLRYNDRKRCEPSAIVW